MRIPDLHNLSAIAVTAKLEDCMDLRSSKNKLITEISTLKKDNTTVLMQKAIDQPFDCFI